MERPVLRGLRPMNLGSKIPRKRTEQGERKGTVARKLMVLKGRLDAHASKPVYRNILGTQDAATTGPGSDRPKGSSSITPKTGMAQDMTSVDDQNDGTGIKNKTRPTGNACTAGGRGQDGRPGETQDRPAPGITDKNRTRNADRRTYGSTGTR